MGRERAIYTGPGAKEVSKNSIDNIYQLRLQLTAIMITIDHDDHHLWIRNPTDNIKWGSRFQSIESHPQSSLF